MKTSPFTPLEPDPEAAIVVVGAGMGGLAAALPLAHAGFDVTIVDSGSAPGGKMRQLPSIGGAVDAGPTVLTMRSVFDKLFQSVGARLDDHVTLHKQDILARHWWPGSGPLDLFADRDRSCAAIEAFSGSDSRHEFEQFCTRTETLWDAFSAPMIETADPDVFGLARKVFSNPSLLKAMAPTATLSRLLTSSFSDPRLRQLFGRYATYVGGSPDRSPALLSLIWQAEEAGVWVVEGGMHALACAIADQITARRGRLIFNRTVQQIETDADGVTGIILDSGERLNTKRIVFNGDPRALATGLLGKSVTQVAAKTTKRPRSLSAQVWAFAAKPKGLPLAHHNVFFCENAKADFDALAAGRTPAETTVYLCAEDRGLPNPPPEIERFEIILNAAPLTEATTIEQEFESCHQRTFQTLIRFGLSFSPQPGEAALTTPQKFDALFPGSAGSLYGQSPHGMFAALERPRAKTKIPGLWLTGGGCHPGAGVPMAALSGRHAAEAILTAQTSTLMSRQTGTRGGMSMRSPIVERGLSRSSRS